MIYLKFVKIVIYMVSLKKVVIDIIFGYKDLFELIMK